MSTSWRISDRVAYVSTSEDRVALIHLDRLGDLVRVLEGTGAAIWHALPQPQAGEPVEAIAQEDLISVMCDSYGVDRDDVADQVVQFLEQLRADGIVERAER